MIDEPLFKHPLSPVGDIERRAMEAYRAKHPDGPPWQELHTDTRVMWVRHTERQQS